MQTPTIRSRCCHALIIVLALNLGITGVCWSEDADNNSDSDSDFDLRPDWAKKKPGWIEKGDELIFGHKKKSGDDDRPMTGPGYDFPANEPEFDVPNEQQNQRRNSRNIEDERRGFSERVTKTQQDLRSKANSSLQACYNDLLYGGDWSVATPPPACKKAIDARYICPYERNGLIETQQSYMNDWAGRWTPIRIFLCPEVFEGLQHPNELMRNLQARKGTKAREGEKQTAEKNTTNAGNNPSGQEASGAPKKAPTAEEVQAYVQKSAAECLRRFPNPSPGQMEACVQEKTDAYKNGAR